MKNASSVLALLATVTISIVVYGQDATPVSEMYLKGKWRGICAVEILDESGIQFCDICPYVINPDNKSSGVLKDIEMNFQSDSITINQNGKVTTVSYTRNKDTHAFNFTLNKKLYNFRVFLYDEQRIIEDQDGLLLVLRKAE